MQFSVSISELEDASEQLFIGIVTRFGVACYDLQSKDADTQGNSDIHSKSNPDWQTHSWSQNFDMAPVENI